MALKVGVDMVSIKRIEKINSRYGERFLNRIFSAVERDRFLNRGAPVSSLAARFAAKEAVLKALGCGIGPAALKEVEIITDPGRAPRVRLYGEAARQAEAAGISEFALSMTHEYPFASAIAAAISCSDGYN